MQRNISLIVAKYMEFWQIIQGKMLQIPIKRDNNIQVSVLKYINGAPF